MGLPAPYMNSGNSVQWPCHESGALAGVGVDTASYAVMSTPLSGRGKRAQIKQLEQGRYESRNSEGELFKPRARAGTCVGATNFSPAMAFCTFFGLPPQKASWAADPLPRCSSLAVRTVPQQTRGPGVSQGPFTARAVPGLRP